MKFPYKHIHSLTNLERVYERKLEVSDQLQAQIDAFDWTSLPYYRITVDYNYKNDQGNQTTCTICADDVWNDHIKPNFVDELTELVIAEFKKLDPTATVKSILNLNINLTSSDPKHNMRESEVHSDSAEFRGEWTLLVHLKGDSGSTVMYDNMIFRNPVKEFSFEPIKVCIYPAIYAHAGRLPDTNTDRIVARYIIQFDSVLNEEVRAKL